MIYTDGIHLMGDNLAELHLFAKNIGLHLCWFHGVKKDHPHYDVINKKGTLLCNSNKQTFLDISLNNGAKKVTTRELIEINNLRKKNFPKIILPPPK